MVVNSVIDSYTFLKLAFVAAISEWGSLAALKHAAMICGENPCSLVPHFGRVRIMKVS